jgi:hypothetical protein
MDVTTPTILGDPLSLMEGCSCYACSAELWVEPFVCHACDQKFCVDCIADSGAVCVRCVKWARQEVCVYDGKCSWEDQEGNTCRCQQPIMACSKHRSRCRVCLAGTCAFCDVYCQVHGFACQCGTNDYKRCSGSCKRWVCLCNSTFVDARRFCRECYVRPCLERGCHGHLVKHFGTCMREFYCYKMACTSVWDRCHDHAALCELFCELRAAIKRKRPACYACTPCWDRLKHGAALLQHLGVPKDIVRLIIEKTVK